MSADAASSPAAVRVKAIDVRPYRWADWCTIADDDHGESEPRLNPIVGRRWADDGAAIWFMLDSHNFLKAAPDELLDLVPYADVSMSPAMLACLDAQDAARMAERPEPPCTHCGGTGRIARGREVRT